MVTRDRTSRTSRWLAGVALSLALLIGAPVAALATDTPGPGDLLITVGDPASVLRYKPATGALLGDFIEPGSGGLYLPQTLTFGPDGNLYVASAGSGNVLRYDGKTGAFIDDFVPAGTGGIGMPYALAFGPDGHLYVTTYFGSPNPGVLRYDGMTGAFIEVFVPGAFNNLAFGPDGNLYVTTFLAASREIQRYEAETGTPLPAPGASGAFFAAGDEGPLTFGPDGDLFASYECRSVRRYDETTGALIGTFVQDVPLPFTQCMAGMVFGPDGNLYIIGFYSTVYRYDGTTGEPIDSYGTGRRGTLGLTFTPYPTSKAECKKDGWKTFGFVDQGQCIKFALQRPPSG